MSEITLDAQKVADVVRQNRDLHRALFSIEVLEEYHAEMTNVIGDARRALAAEPEFDGIPDYVQVDASWADTLPTCVACGGEVPWADALLMPCSTVEDGDVDRMGVVHRQGCPRREAEAVRPLPYLGE